jgi:hypothetical protein
MWHAWRKAGVYTGFWWEKPVSKMPLGRPRRSCARILLKWIFKEKDKDKWTGLMRLRIRTNGLD